MAKPRRKVSFMAKPKQAPRSRGRYRPKRKRISFMVKR